MEEASIRGGGETAPLQLSLGLLGLLGVRIPHSFLLFISEENMSEPLWAAYSHVCPRIVGPGPLTPCHFWSDPFPSARNKGFPSVLPPPAVRLPTECAFL